MPCLYDTIIINALQCFSYKMILLDLSDMDIKPIAKNELHFKKWLLNYPFYANVDRDGVKLYARQ